MIHTCFLFEMNGRGDTPPLKQQIVGEGQCPSRLRYFFSSASNSLAPATRVSATEEW